MIFDEADQTGGKGMPSGSVRRSRRSGTDTPSRERGSGRRRRSKSSFVEASRMSEPEYPAAETNHVAWLWALGLLVVATLGFGWYLNSQRLAPQLLPGEAPTIRLQPYVDPILAPLETGLTGYSPESLSDLAAQFRTERQEAGELGRNVFGMAGTMADILQEALEDRSRHLERLVNLGSPVEGLSPDPARVRADLGEIERKHLELAVAVSWQRNSGAYRDRLEELWTRLEPLEHGRFSAGPKVAPSN